MRAGYLDREYQPFRDRYLRGEWRALIFRDLILADIKSSDRPPVIVDIGCGNGFDGSRTLQESLAQESAEYIGIDPDRSLQRLPHFSDFHSCQFERAVLEEESVDIAFCVMVLEHVSDPAAFWMKVREILKPGGIFWGFTMDRRHGFCHVSQLSERLMIKNYALNLMRGERGRDRYENFPTYYRANSPRQIGDQVSGFASAEFINFSRIGQLDYYVPRLVRPAAHFFDFLQMSMNLPGSLLAVRLKKHS